MTKEEESALVERLKEGDAQARETFFRQFFGAVREWVLTRGARQVEDVQEIVREAFIRAFKSIAGFQQRSTLKTWLFKVASNAMKDYYKSPKHQPVPKEADISEVESWWIPDTGSYRRNASDDRDGNRTPVPPSDGGDLGRLVREERRQKIRAALERLSPNHRQVLHLRLIEGLSLADTADIMEREVSAVKMLQLRAAEAFKAVVAQDPYFNDGAPSKEVSH